VRTWLPLTQEVVFYNYMCQLSTAQRVSKSCMGAPYHRRHHHLIRYAVIAGCPSPSLQWQRD
jgi:hypothetical protein